MGLCGISSRFQLLSPTPGQVTHALLTRSPLSQEKQAPLGSVRLACVRRAASVRPEPGSNSLIMVSKAFRLQIFSKVLPAKFPLLVSLLYPEILKFFSRVIPPKLPFRVPRFSSLVVHFSRCCFPAARAFPSSGTFSLAWNGQTVKRIFLENDGFFTTHFFPQFLHRPTPAPLVDFSTFSTRAC